MSQELSNWYRDNFDKLSSGPEDDVWRKISSRLDASAALQQKERSRRRLALLLLLFAIVSSAALTFYFVNSPSTIRSFAQRSSLSGTPTLNAHSHEDTIASTSTTNTTLPFFPTPVVIDCMGQSIGIVNQQERRGSAVAPVIAEHYILNPIVNEKSEALLGEVDTKKSRPAIDNSPVALTSNHSELHEPPITPVFSYQNFIFQPPAFYTLSNPSLKFNQSLFSLEPPRETEDRQLAAMRNSYISVYCNIKNSYLLNSQTYSGFSRHGCDLTHFVFTGGYGLRYGHYITNSVNLEAQISFKDKFEQRYTIYEEGKIHGEAVSLNGFSAGITARFRSGSFLDRSLYFVVGGQCLFTRTFVSHDSRYGSVENDYRHVIPLFTLGAEQELFSLRGYRLLAGLRSNIGLTNLTANAPDQYSGLTKTRISDFSLYVSVQRSLAR